MEEEEEKEEEEGVEEEENDHRGKRVAANGRQAPLPCASVLDENSGQSEC